MKSYKNRNLKNDRCGQIKGAISIENRPQVVDLKTRIGDWELDAIVGKVSGSVLVTMVERYSRYTMIAKAINRSAAEVSMAIMTRLIEHRERLHTLTFDNGKEFSDHALIDNIFRRKPTSIKSLKIKLQKENQNSIDVLENASTRKLPMRPSSTTNLRTTVLKPLG